MARDKNRELIGKEIEIWWPGDERFYPGKIVKFQTRGNLHRIQYNDGDVENLDLSTEHWRFVDTSNSPPPGNGQNPALAQEQKVTRQVSKTENKALPKESKKKVQRPLPTQPVTPHPRQTSPILAGVHPNPVSSSGVTPKSSASSSPVHAVGLKLLVGHLGPRANRSGKNVGTVSTSLPSPPARRPAGLLQTGVQQLPGKPGAIVIGVRQQGPRVAGVARGPVVQIPSPVYNPQAKPVGRSRTEANKRENILASPPASAPFAQPLGTPSPVMPMALANKQHIIAKPQNQPLPSPGATKINLYPQPAQANRIQASVPNPRNDKQLGGRPVSFTGNISDSLVKSRDGVRRASTGAVQASTAHGSRELGGLNLGSVSMRNDLAKFSVRPATNLIPNPQQKLNLGPPMNPVRVASENTPVQVSNPPKPDPKASKRGRKIAPRRASTNAPSPIPIASTKGLTIQRSLKPSPDRSPVYQHAVPRTGGLPPGLRHSSPGVGELKGQVFVQGKGNVTSDRVNGIPAKLRAPPALQPRPMGNHKANVVRTGQTTGSLPSAPTARIEMRPAPAEVTSSKGSSSSGAGVKRPPTPKELEKAVRSNAARHVPPPHNVVIPISRAADVTAAKQPNLGGARKAPPVSAESPRARGSSSIQSKSLESESEPGQKNEPGSLLRKRSRPPSPAQKNKKIRQDGLDLVLQKLSESEEKQAARTDKVHSALLSGIASIRKTVRPEDGSWMNQLVNALVSRLGTISSDALGKKLDEHVARLSTEMKDIRKDIDTKFAQLRKESKKTEDDVRLLKSELALFKTSIREEVARFTTALDDKLAQFSSAPERRCEVAPSTPVALSTSHSPTIPPSATQLRDGRMLQLSSPSPAKTSPVMMGSQSAHGSNKSGAASDRGSDSVAQEKRPNNMLSLNGHSDTNARSVSPLHAQHSQHGGLDKKESQLLSTGPISGYPASGRPNGESASPLGQNQRQAHSASLGSPRYNTVVNRGSPHDQQEAARKEQETLAKRNRQSKIKQRAKAIVARAVTIWLLETDHHCSAYDRVSWAQQTSAKCLRSVVNESLSRFESGEQALNVLSASLGSDLVRLEWFTCRATPHNLALARANYDPWDPPPKDDEWKVEEILLREISERYFLAECAYSFDDHSEKGLLATAIEICHHAGSPDIYKVITDTPTGPMPRVKQKWYICKRLGSSNVYARLKAPPDAGWAICRVEEGENVDENVPAEAQ